MRVKDFTDFALHPFPRRALEYYKVRCPVLIYGKIYRDEMLPNCHEKNYIITRTIILSFPAKNGNLGVMKPFPVSIETYP